MEAHVTFDKNALLSHIGGDKSFLRELLAESITILPDHLDHIDNAIEEGNAEKLRKAAHKMRGGLRAIYALNAAHLAAELETAAESGDLEKSSDIRDELSIVMDETIEELRKNIT